MTLIRTGRSRLLAVGATAALAAGLLGVAGIALAQEEPGGTPPAQHQHQSGDGSCDGHQGSGGHSRGAMFGSTVAELLGIEPNALAEALRSGQTLAEIARDNGVDPQTVIDALVAEMNTRIDQAVSDGRITAERAEEMKANAVERTTTMVEQGPQHKQEGQFGRHGRMR